MEIHGKSILIDGDLGKSILIDGDPWEIDSHRWGSRKIDSHRWRSMGNRFSSMRIHGSSAREFNLFPFWYNARVEVELIKIDSNGKRIFEIDFNENKCNPNRFQIILNQFLSIVFPSNSILLQHGRSVAISTSF